MTYRLAKALNFRPGELSLAVLAACFYFCVLCGYFFLRPVREAMGVSGGMGALYWYFLSTSVASLVVVFCSAVSSVGWIADDLFRSAIHSLSCV